MSEKKNEPRTELEFINEYEAKTWRKAFWSFYHTDTAPSVKGIIERADEFVTGMRGRSEALGLGSVGAVFVSRLHHIFGRSNALANQFMDEAQKVLVCPIDPCGSGRDLQIEFQGYGQTVNMVWEKTDDGWTLNATCKRSPE